MKALRSTLTALIAIMLAATLSAQNPPPPTPVEPPSPLAGPGTRAARPPALPLEIQIVVARYQGEKRIASVPYVMAVNANGERASLNMGAEVAIPNTTFTPAGDAGKAQPIVSYNYRSVGTSIVCGATTTSEDGRFEVNISVDDNSVYLKEDNAPPATPIAGLPAFRSFKSRNTLLLRDGQTRQYTAATDRVSGETIRIDVSLKVVK